MIGQLLDFTIDMLASQSGSSDNAKLLAILSDGRGIFSEGIDKVTAAVRRCKLLNVFLVFIIVDNPLNKVRNNNTKMNKLEIARVLIRYLFSGFDTRYKDANF